MNAPFMSESVFTVPSPRNARVAGIASVFPEHAFTQEEAFGLVERWLTSSATSVPAAAAVPGVLAAGVSPELPLEKIKHAFEHAGVRARAAALPIDELLSPRTLGEKNRLYLEHAERLGIAAIEKVLAKTGVEASAIDLIISTSCTGFAIPSLDARLVNRFGFRPDVRRLPITELGCAAGVAALRFGQDFLRAYPGSKVLVVAMELPTLTFQPTDFTADHLVSCAIFGDGAAALILDDERAPGIALTGSASRFFPGTEAFMGYDLEATGFHIFLSRRIPRFIGETLMPAVSDLVRTQSVAAPPARWLVHPGGPKILDAVEKALGLSHGGLTTSRDVLRDHGNISSVTIFLVMEEYLRTLEARDLRSNETLGILAVGPGFQVDVVFAEARVASSGGGEVLQPGVGLGAAAGASSSGYFSR